MKRILAGLLVLPLLLVCCFGAAGAQEAGETRQNKTKVTLYNGQTVQLKVEGTEEPVQWSSSDEKRAAVDETGLVTAKKTGKVTITARAGKKKVKFAVTIQSPLKVSYSSVRVKIGQAFRTICTFFLQGKLNYEIGNPDLVACRWDENWETIASGNTIGLTVIGKKTGKTTITVTNSKTKDKVKIQVEVKKNSVKKTGDMQNLLGMTLSEANARIADRLTDSGEAGFYGNGYFTVRAVSGTIDWVSIRRGSKYHLAGVYPGMEWQRAAELLSEEGWDFDSVPEDTGEELYTKGIYRMTLREKNGKVGSISILLQ